MARPEGFELFDKDCKFGLFGKSISTFSSKALKFRKVDVFRFGDLSLERDLVWLFKNPDSDLFGLGLEVLVPGARGSLEGVSRPFDREPRFFMSFGLGTKVGSM